MWRSMQMPVIMWKYRAIENTEDDGSIGLRKFLTKISRTHKFHVRSTYFFTDSVSILCYLIQNVLPVCLGGNNFLYILQGYRDGHSQSVPGD